MSQEKTQILGLLILLGEATSVQVVLDYNPLLSYNDILRLTKISDVTDNSQNMENRSRRNLYVIYIYIILLYSKQGIFGWLVSVW